MTPAAKMGAIHAIAMGAAFLAVKFSSWRFLIIAGTFLIISIIIFVTTRHIQLLNRRRQYPITWQRDDSRSMRPAEDYYLFVLGSGGHTKEMLMMMDDGFCDFENVHRRYLISSGDKMSENHLLHYEKELQLLCQKKGTSPGTFDTCIVTRARRVHQPLWTTPYTALLSFYDIVNILLTPPMSEVGKTVRFPRIVLSNGPATGFFVGLAAYLLKMFYVVPEDRMWFAYIESWARISTLSLTGKLFHYSRIADAFAVQHKEVGLKYGIDFAGPLVFNARRPDVSIDS